MSTLQVANIFLSTSNNTQISYDSTTRNVSIKYNNTNPLAYFTTSPTSYENTPGSSYLLSVSNVAPNGYIEVTNATLNIASYPYLSSIIGTYYDFPWVQRTGYDNTDNLYAITYSSLGGYVAVDSFSGNVKTSTDAITWVGRPTAQTTSIYDITATTSAYIAVGVNNAVQSSTDGITWTNRGGSGSAAAYYGVVWTGTDAIVVGGDTTLNTPLLKSYNATGTSSSNKTSANASTVLYDAAFGNTVLVVVGGHSTNTSAIGSIQTGSSGGASMTNRTPGALPYPYNNSGYYFNSVTYGNGIFMAFARLDFNDPLYETNQRKNFIQTSTNGITWATTVINDTGSFDNVSYGNGIFILSSGQDGEGIFYVLVSFDNGTTWSRRYLPNPGQGFAPTNFVYNNGIFVGVCPNVIISTNTISYNPSTQFVIPPFDQKYYSPIDSGFGKNYIYTQTNRNYFLPG